MKKKYINRKLNSKRKKIVAIVAAVIFILCDALICLLYSQGVLDKKDYEGYVPDAPFSVHYIDVGQGDSSLVCCDGNYILIDAGKSFAGDTVVNYIRNLGIEKLDMLIATHTDSDHIGGFEKVVDEFEIGTFLSPAYVKGVSESKVYDEILEKLEDKNVSISEAQLNAVYNFGEGVMTVLGPVDIDTKENNSLSTVCRFVYKNSSFLFTGDATKAEENDMIEAGADLNSDIIKIGHHGSKSSSSWDFLYEVSPVTAVISCGADNDYGHPADEILTRLYQLNCGYYRTDVYGTVIISTDGDKYDFKTEKGTK